MPAFNTGSNDFGVRAPRGDLRAYVMKSIVRRKSEEDENESNGSRLACDFKSDQMRVLVRGLDHDL